MKIIFVTNSSANGGASKMITFLYNEVKKILPESKIVFIRKEDSQYSNIENAYYLTTSLKSPIAYFKVSKKLYHLIKLEKPDAIISFLPLANILSAYIGKKLGVKYRIASQRNPPQIYGKVVRFFDKFIGSRGFYTSNVCNSQAGLEAFSKYPESYKKNLSVINNCVEPADLSISQEEAREKLGIATDKVVLTCVGRLHDQKNHELLVKTMKHVDNAILYLAGDGPLRHKITNQINLLGVENKIVLLGDLEREQVRLLLRASDIFVIPSKYEGLSNSLIEAMSYGLPIVFSNIPSFTNFLQIDAEDKYAGILANNDEIEWAKAINHLMSENTAMEKYRNLSLLKVADLTPEKMTSRFLKLTNDTKA
ncbi:glycosyltransferase [Arcticibacterium luteifluviistationis]|uniref:Glycosyl transferase family 1 domain-containing protein n=1 Tax=Arcticibacterium luteifluviistationis TaxID=1784714 RepID=A0A2Z4G9Z7_9BACT|nr:glycosyltransferase [Arcticibacterium luteifluviistationis]AWV98041.1 hypothetical protein DJ013_07595 [Arcticibacterium luteifluviistationis]